MDNNIQTADSPVRAEGHVASLTREQIHSRYLELCDLLNISPPQFQIKPAADMRKCAGKHVSNDDGSYSIFLSDEVHVPDDIDVVLIHELSHHALCLAGYHSSGHAWVMLATEKLLSLKAGSNFDSIIWDAKKNWPKRTYWGSWLQHVEYAYALTNQPEVEDKIASSSARELAIWVLGHRPDFEKHFGKSALGRKLLERHHAIIADRRWGLLLAKWSMETLLFGSFILFALSNTFDQAWLKSVSSAVFAATLLMLFGMFAIVGFYAQAAASASGLWRRALRIKSLLRRQ